MLGRSEIDRRKPAINSSPSRIRWASSSFPWPSRTGEQVFAQRPAIIAWLAEATLALTRRWNWEGLIGNYDLIRDHIEHVIDGFESFNERIREDVF